MRGFRPAKRPAARALPLLIGTAPACAPAVAAIGCCNGGMHLTAKQFLKDLAFTFAAAVATGAVVGGVSFVVARFFVA